MPIVPAKCTSCGAALTVDDSKDAAICQFCGTAFVVEKAIKNYNITNNINANVVNVVSQDESEQEFKNAEALILIGDHAEALEIYSRLAKTHANDPRTWTGLLRAISKDREYYPVDKVEVTAVTRYYKSLAKIDPSAAEEWKPYYDRVTDEYDSLVSEVRDSIAERERKIQSLSKSNLIAWFAFGGIVVLLIILLLAIPGLFASVITYVWIAGLLALVVVFSYSLIVNAKIDRLTGEIDELNSLISINL